MDKNIKTILVQHCDLKKEILKLENRLEKIRKQSPMVSDVVQNGYKRHAVIFGYDIIRDSKLKKLEKILQERYDKLLDMQTEIETYISSIERSDIRQIFEHRYIDDMSWVQIQMAMGYKHEDTARNKHDKYLKKIA